MTILAAIRREERKLEKQLGKLKHQLSGVRAAAKALGESTSRGLMGAKKRVLSAAGRGENRSRSIEALEGFVGSLP